MATPNGIESGLVGPRTKFVNRRTWNGQEEHSLADCIREIVAEGWKSDNSFRNGYLLALEKKMAARHPESNLGHKHISSKMTVWKRTWALISSMLCTSGFGWNDTTAQVLVESDDVWAHYVKANPEVENMRYRFYPFFPIWCEVFGKDRATGEGAFGFNEVQHQVPSPESNQKFSCDEEVGSSSKEAKISTPNVVGKKRKASKDFVAPIISMMKEYMDKSDEFFKNVASTMDSPEVTYSAKSKRVIAMIERVCVGFSDREVIFATSQILNIPSNMEMFLNYDDGRRLVFVRMLLDGKAAKG